MAVNGRRPTKSSPSLTYNGATINLLALSASLISRLNDGEMVTTISDDMFAPDVIRDPFRYYGRIRDEDPVHWNELYQLWVITRHDDLVWMARNHEQFSNSVWKNDPLPAYPAIYDSNQELYDFISMLASGEKSGVFTRQQVLVNTSPLLAAGHETTINLICNGTLALMNNRSQWDLLKTDTQGLMVRATEEALRYDPPVKSIQRMATENVEIRGKVLKKEDRLRWFTPSANRDPNKFEDPDTFDITRWPNPHVAFGAGVHHCLGATIARVEAQEVFTALAERYPNLESKDRKTEYQESLTFRSVKSLPVSLD